MMTFLAWRKFYYLFAMSQHVADVTLEMTGISSKWTVIFVVKWRAAAKALLAVTVLLHVTPPPTQNARSQLLKNTNQTTPNICFTVYTASLTFIHMPVLLLEIKFEIARRGSENFLRTHDWFRAEFRQVTTLPTVRAAHPKTRWKVCRHVVPAHGGGSDGGSDGRVGNVHTPITV